MSKMLTAWKCKDQRPWQCFATRKNNGEVRSDARREQKMCPPGRGTWLFRGVFVAILSAVCGCLSENSLIPKHSLRLHGACRYIFSAYKRAKKNVKSFVGSPTFFKQPNSHVCRLTSFYGKRVYCKGKGNFIFAASLLVKSAPRMP